MNTKTIHKRNGAITVAWAILLAVVVGMMMNPAVSIAGQDDAKAESKKDGKKYLAYNIWYEKPKKISSINYRRGTMIPAGTEVAAVQTSELGIRRPHLKFKTAEDEVTYTIYFYKKFHPGVSLEKFRDRLITDKPFEEHSKGLTKDEIDAILEGRLIVGMTREAVIMSRGYPPEHRTPSTKNRRWLYWENRFRKKAVNFDDEGKTVREAAARDDL